MIAENMDDGGTVGEMNKLKAIVKSEYAKIFASSNAQKEVEVQNIVEENRRKLDTLSKQRFQLDDVESLDVHDELSKKLSPLPIPTDKKLTIKNPIIGKTQQIFVRLLPEIKPLPTMLSWMPVQQNYLVDDEKVLSNIPYMSDNVDNNFVESLRANYEKGIHGLSGTSRDFLNDEMFFQLVQNVTKHYNADRDEDESDIPPDVIFTAISEIFPDKGAVPDLKSKFRDLLEKHRGILLTRSDQSNPNIDGPGAVAASWEQILHSFSHLYCRRCYKYDCFMHPAPVQNFKRKQADLNLSGMTCTECYLSLPEDKSPKSEKNEQNLSPSTSVVGVGKSSKRSKKRKLASSDDEKSETSSVASVLNEAKRLLDLNFDYGEWTPAEISLFRGFSMAFEDNYCAIAMCMENKTCKQVYAFAMKDRQEAPRKLTTNLLDSNSVKTKKFRHKDWHKNYTKVASLKESDGESVLKVVSSFVPCSHDVGNVDCTQQRCHCIGKKTFCEKFCNCSPDCPNRFPGCRCRARCDTKQCPCYLAVRECDPDLCPNCGAADFSSTEIRCQNVNIQRGLKKHLLLGVSDVAGWGCFLKEAVEKNAFISEYCGEMISQEEAERRGYVYDNLNCSFLFNLNEDLVVDATRKGNKIRFANHSVNPNCCAKVMMVNGDHRIGIFAKSAIAAGEELFFDYRYGPKEQLAFVSKERDHASTSTS